jgi:hypothetical protein
MNWSKQQQKLSVLARACLEISGPCLQNNEGRAQKCNKPFIAIGNVKYKLSKQALHGWELKGCNKNFVKKGKFQGTNLCYDV